VTDEFLVKHINEKVLFDNEVYYCEEDLRRHGKVLVDTGDMFMVDIANTPDDNDSLSLIRLNELINNKIRCDDELIQEV
jgi:hypothetical protein